MISKQPVPALISLLIEPGAGSDRAGFAAAVSQVVQSQATILISTDPETGSLWLDGDSETQLNNLLAQLKNSGLDFTAGPPQVAYQETISRKVKTDYTHKRYRGGKGEFARVIIEIEPRERGSRISLEYVMEVDALPNAFVAGIESGVNSVLVSGPVWGVPCTDMNIKLMDAAFHDTDSSAIAFEIATRAALRQASEAAGPIMLEPVMKAEILSTTKYLGAIIKDLNARRGRVVTSAEHGDAVTLTALVPLANLLGYQHQLNQMSAGLATFKMEYSHYQEVTPPSGPENFPPAMSLRR